MSNKRLILLRTLWLSTLKLFKKADSPDQWRILSVYTPHRFKKQKQNGSINFYFRYPYLFVSKLCVQCLILSVNHCDNGLTRFLQF